MAFDMDELKRRRQEREQQRQERLRQQKKLMARLAIAGGVLLACGILILILSLSGGRTSQPPQPSQTTGPAQTEQTEPSTQPTQPPQTVIHFAAAGDLNITDDVVAAGGVNFDYTEAFMDVVPLLSQADLTAINLEGNLIGSPYGKDSAPPTLLTALKNAGVDLVQMANSRSINKGVLGLKDTLSAIRSAGLESVGAFADSQEFRQTGGYTVRVVDGVKVAIVAFTKGMDSMALPAGSEDCVNLLYTDYASTYKEVDTQGITKILENVAEESPDVTIALVHWGSEYNETHSDSQIKIRDLLLSLGVDAIIGTHPHYVQEMLFDQAAGTFVAYSLGDFFGDASRSGTEYSVVLDLEITKNNATGETKVTGYSYTPIFTARDRDGLLRVLRLENAIAAYEAGHIDRVSQEDHEAMTYALERIGERVTPETEPAQEEE